MFSEILNVSYVHFAKADISFYINRHLICIYYIQMPKKKRCERAVPLRQGQPCAACRMSATRAVVLLVAASVRTITIH